MEERNLKRILDTTEIDIDNPEIRSDLDIDLRRMDLMKHEAAPEDADTYSVVVRPSTKTYYLGLYRFIFNIQYGKMEGEEFKPMGEPEQYQSETLPMM